MTEPETLLKDMSKIENTEERDEELPKLRSMIINQEKRFDSELFKVKTMMEEQIKKQDLILELLKAKPANSASPVKPELIDDDFTTRGKHALDSNAC